jgi:hypothetical protein
MSNPRPERAVVLERVEQALAQRLAATTPPPVVAARTTEEAGWRDAGGCAEQVEGSLARAEQRSREAEALIEEVAAALAAWRERAVQLRQRLAEWPTRAL